MSINQLLAKTFFSESVQSLSTRVLLSAVGGQKESICRHPPVHGSKQATGGLSCPAQKLSSTEERLLLSSVVEPSFFLFYLFGLPQRRFRKSSRAKKPRTKRALFLQTLFWSSHTISNPVSQPALETESPSLPCPNDSTSSCPFPTPPSFAQPRSQSRETDWGKRVREGQNHLELHGNMNCKNASQDLT